MTNLRYRIAFSLAVIQDSDYFYDEIEEWESMDDRDKETNLDEYPEMAYEDREQFLEYADRLIRDLGLEKWNDGPNNSKERFMTRWFDRDGV